ncbi:MAG TPA: LysR family transcriptional regulator [Solirubrobacterales bacterium]|jgi:DNA-binding transcriptional LysR family regulator|nr:LysR family transcriptional regulator [Solirubrobacterales bacterium]
MNVELRHLRYFLAVADELHFGRAAERVHVAQPAISQQIRRLEAEIGTELFHRNRREVRLAPAGEALRDYAVRAIDEVNDGVEAARRAARGEIGNLTVGFLETAASTIVPRAVRQFRAARPDVNLTLRELGVGAQIDDLQAGRLDVGIIRPPADADDLVFERIIDEELIAAVPSGHPLAARDQITARTVVDQPLVLLSREVVPGLYDQVLAIRQEESGSGAIAQEATSIQAVLGLVSAELGISVMPASVRSLSREGVEFVAIRSAHRSALLTARRRDDDSPVVEAFLAAARAAASA